MWRGYWLSVVPVMSLLYIAAAMSVTVERTHTSSHMDRDVVGFMTVSLQKLYTPMYS